MEGQRRWGKRIIIHVPPKKKKEKEKRFESVATVDGYPDRRRPRETARTPGRGPARRRGENPSDAGVGTGQGPGQGRVGRPAENPSDTRVGTCQGPGQGRVGRPGEKGRRAGRWARRVRLQTR